MPDAKISPKIVKGTTISGSATGLALLINWIYKLRFGYEIPPDVAIVMAGIFSFIAGRIWTIVDQILEKRFGIDADGEKDA